MAMDNKASTTITTESATALVSDTLDSLHTCTELHKKLDTTPKEPLPPVLAGIPKWLATVDRTLRYVRIYLDQKILKDDNAVLVRGVEQAKAHAVTVRDVLARVADRNASTEPGAGWADCCRAAAEEVAAAAGKKSDGNGQSLEALLLYLVQATDKLVWESDLMLQKADEEALELAVRELTELVSPGSGKNKGSYSFVYHGSGDQINNMASGQVNITKGGGTAYNAQHMNVTPPAAGRQ